MLGKVSSDFRQESEAEKLYALNRLHASSEWIVGKDTRYRDDFSDPKKSQKSDRYFNISIKLNDRQKTEMTKIKNRLKRFESPLKNSDSVSRLTDALSGLHIEKSQPSNIKIPLKRP